MESCQLGLRKCLGYDFHRRRYWALGGGAAAWRVYVEEREGTTWGWYEGARLSGLSRRRPRGRTHPGPELGRGRLRHLERHLNPKP
jgi:hypothetical protein